ncbi:MAG: hypothetical protein IT317_24825 [Anaerolineales bacterium]|nr:hypothetical protein [Anaerolineales bacterium]
MNADALTLARDAGCACGLRPHTALALAYRLHHGAWPWLQPGAIAPPVRHQIRLELGRAGLTRGGAPHLPTIRAAAEVWRAGKAVEHGR